jgi:hypothetical protein
VITASHPDSEPARDLLLRAADEVALCRLLVARVEATLAEKIDAGMLGGEAPQAIDLLDQILADLATCVAGLADGLPADTMLVSGPVLARLRLDDLRRRLTGAGADGGETPPSVRVALF